MIRESVSGLILAGAVAGLASSAYLLGLTAAAAVARKRRLQPVEDTPSTKFAVLIPAHNEEEVVRTAIMSNSSTDYPQELLTVFVIADNCEDTTAAVARKAGAQVLVRSDEHRRGKGYALNWALSQIRLSQYDAVMMMDADSQISPSFFRAMDARLKLGARVIQAYYGVLHPRSTTSALRYASFALVHYIRPLGKVLFGGSCGLKGNGMVFATDVLEPGGWQAYSVTEDVEQHVYLLERGFVVEFAPEAGVWSEMPASLEGSRTQNLRWEAGRSRAARRHALRLLWRGIRERSPAMMDAAMELLIPPISVVGGLALFAIVTGIVLGSPVLTVVGGLSAGALGAHVIFGLLLAGAPPIVWWSLVVSPAYVAWKILLYARALLGSGASDWVRTPRLPSRP